MADDELVEYLRSLGADDADIAAAAPTGHLPGLAADLVLAEADSRSARVMAKELGLPLDEILAVWRTLGVVVPDPDQPCFSEADTRLTGVLVGLRPVLGHHGDELLRVIGSSISRVAEAAIAMYVQTVEEDLAASGAQPVDFARESADTARAALGVGDGFGAIFRHHLRDAVRRQRVAQSAVAERSLARLAVGFVDLVGFTALSRTLSPRDLIDVLRDFETRAFDLAIEHGGRVVKHIGDEVMFVALDADAGCATALALIDGYTDAGITPRGGLAFGDLVTRHGDYYGSVVNLASRLADLAIPGEVLLTPEVAAAVSASNGVAFTPAGRRLLKGFDEPVEVLSLSRT